jgi:hypothetical protein
MKLIKHGAVFLSLLALASCGQEPMKAETSANGATAYLIATVDGCRVWRVWDGVSVYFARCPEGAVTTKYERQQGKTTVPQYTVGTEDLQ